MSPMAMAVACKVLPTRLKLPTPAKKPTMAPSSIVWRTVPSRKGASALISQLYPSNGPTSAIIAA